MESDDGIISVLIIGGSGYLGQHTIDRFSELQEVKLSYTYCTNRITCPSNVSSFRLDLASENEEEICEVLRECLPHIVIHMAAWSELQKCQRDYDGAVKVNSSRPLLCALRACVPSSVFIYISTDQVYGEHKSDDENPFSENDLCNPINFYGASKLEFEKMINDTLNESPHHIILRSSNIIGPPAPYNGKGSFIQWLDSRLHTSKCPIDLFADEKRNFIFVDDIIRILLSIVTRVHNNILDKEIIGSIYNMGGTASLSRADIGEMYAKAVGLLNEPLQISHVTRGNTLSYPSPLNLGMNSTKLWSQLDILPTDIAEALKLIVSKRTHFS